MSKLRIEYDQSRMRDAYRQLHPKYERLAVCLKQALKHCIAQHGIEASVSYRIKSFESFWDKHLSKRYSDPFNQTEDFCGLRVICTYKSEADKIVQILQSEFNVKTSEDKEAILEDDAFGYRSHHLIVTIKNDWLNIPPYHGLNDLKAEIQVRTILMHAWAEVHHRLAYKKQDYAPPPLKRSFKRELSQLSAIFGMADTRFDALREQKEEYKHKFSLKTKTLGYFDPRTKLNLENIGIFLDQHFPKREKSMQNHGAFLDEIKRHDVSTYDMVKAIDKTQHILEDIEKEIFGTSIETMRWDQLGAVRTVLDLTSDAYWQGREAVSVLESKIINKWRTGLLKIDT